MRSPNRLSSRRRWLALALVSAVVALGALAGVSIVAAQEPPPAPPGGGPAPPGGGPAPRPRPPRGPAPAYALIVPAAASSGQTVLVRGRRFPRRRPVSVVIEGNEVATATTNSIGSFAAGFIVQRGYRRGVVQVISKVANRQVITPMRFTVRRSAPSAVVTSSTRARMTLSRTGGPPGAGYRLVARGLPPETDVRVEVAGREAASGKAGKNGVFIRFLRIPNLELGRRELRLHAGRLSLNAFIDVHTSARDRLPPGRVTLAAAGDIACQPGQARTFTKCRYLETARVLGRLNPQVVAAVGDHQYFAATITATAGAFDGTWGIFKDRIRPSISDHDYQVPGATGYFTYFGARAAPPHGYYSYNVAGWHIISLNTNCPRYLSCAPGSPQEQWLRADLAANPRRCTLAIGHHPLYTSAGHIGTAQVQPLVQALYDYGADVFLAGHAHVYERFAPQDVNSNHDPARGIRHFTVGTGGKDLGRFVRAAPNSERRLRTFGILGLKLRPYSYRWQFHPIKGFNQRDAGSGVCH